MVDTVPTIADLTAAIAVATRAAVRQLFGQHPEQFYYLSLITTGGHAPYLSAWSEEALQAACRQADPKAAAELRWSYADSPYCAFGYEEYFGAVRDLFAQRPRMDQDWPIERWSAELDTRLQAMEAALASLDAEGLFGSGRERLQIVVNAEVMPPDSSNTERAYRLNPSGAIGRWLREAAE